MRDHQDARGNGKGVEAQTGKLDAPQELLWAHGELCL